MRHETLTYQADGLTMHSELYFEGGVTGKRPGILVFPEAFGLSEHAKSRAQRLAGLGYIALACDLHGEGKIIPSLEEVMSVIGPLREAPERIRARAQGGLTALLARPEVEPSQIAAVVHLLEVMVHDDDEEELTEEDRRALRASQEYFRRDG